MMFEESGDVTCVPLPSYPDHDDCSASYVSAWTRENHNCALYNSHVTGEKMCGENAQIKYYNR